MSSQFQYPTRRAAVQVPSFRSGSFGLLQRKCECGGSKSSGGECAECKKKLQRSEARGGPGIAPPIVHDVLRSPGQPLDEGARAFLEPRLGHDFSKVRTHADSKVVESARAANVPAYQTKLTVNEPGDEFEQEADRMADAVMRTPEPAIHNGISTVLAGKSMPRQVRPAPVLRRTSPQSGLGAGAAPSAAQEVLRSAGQTLDPASRNFLEPRFGADFGDVRVHTDSKAAESAAAVNALAYTVGRQIVFAQNQYSPHSTAGRRLLAHELVHVLQQNENPALPVQRTCGEAAIATEVGGRSGCTDKFDDTFLSGLPLFKFNIECDDFAAGEEAKLQSFVGGLAAGTSLEIHGFASSDGPKAFNENLGCARASAAFSAITTPAPPGFAGIEASRITAVVNHGPVKSSTGSLANQRSVVIRTSGPGPKPGPPNPPAPQTLQTVHFPDHIRGTATPASMVPDRIPPRVDTPVDVVFGGTADPSAPVTLSLDGANGGNGSATINGNPTHSFAVTGTERVQLRGVDQTDPGKAGNLKLVARQRGSLLAESNGFSVSSIPQNMSFTFNSLVVGANRGIVVDFDWESDSGAKPDLNQAEQSERIELNPGTGVFAGPLTASTSCYINSTSAQHDTNAEVAGLRDEGSLSAKQTFMFRDNRTGASEIPMTNSGFLVSWIVSSTGFLFKDYHITTSRVSVATSAHDPNPACPAGTIASAAGTGSVSKTQDE